MYIHGATLVFCACFARCVLRNVNTYVNTVNTYINTYKLGNLCVLRGGVEQLIGEHARLVDDRPAPACAQ